MTKWVLVYKHQCICTVLCGVDCTLGFNLFKCGLLLTELSDWFSCFPRKLLREDQLEAGTKAAQQEELERLKRLEQQRKEFVLPTLPFELLQGKIRMLTALL